MRPRSLTRRAVLAGGAAAAAVTACSTSGSPRPSPVTEPPEQVLLRTLIADKERTVALYSSLVAAGHDALAPFRDRHQAHLDELRKHRRPATPSAKPTTPSPSQPTPTATPKTSLPKLRDLERRSAAQRTRQLADASPALAQLIASIGACEAAHVLALPRSL
ncbi:hypothetical protein ABT294_12070 [Nonomuraea sp. NPDC000554]|uniref:hypothetical protein n=1 Tax=Nonomuraea sp. NPDC000554 TaxID=3154259 RepID=UPI00331C1D5D